MGKVYIFTDKKWIKIKSKVFVCQILSFGDRILLNQRKFKLCHHFIHNLQKITDQVCPLWGGKDTPI